jgi:hypothetical protein
MGKDRKVTFDRIIRPDGTSEVDDFLDGLPAKDRAKLEAKSDKTPEREIEHAKNMMEKYLKETPDDLD